LPTKATFTSHTCGRLARALGAATAAALALAAAAQANVIYNPSFAQGLQGWRAVAQATGGLPGFPHILALHGLFEPLRKCDRAQRGHPFLQLNVPAGAAAYVEQSIIVPVRPGHLRFRTWGGHAPVKVTVSILSGPFARRQLTFTAPALLASPGGCSKMRPRMVSLGMARFAGQAVSLRVRATSTGTEAAFADFASFEL
jgi:hypothetical protein